ncbi:hypothetical protein AC3_A0578 [Clostridium perfringens E str. JGS1987]|uniref:Uncharacterized protein n=1 Tax=Clostridium perfringens E str. JGS1987 TaxID=451755 RepID=B1BSY3_CLOPF|nr:hypothetical protein AC3_A0578 [Clostridium perfringens E str. JGS1987]
MHIDIISKYKFLTLTYFKFVFNIEVLDFINPLLLKSSIINFTSSSIYLILIFLLFDKFLNNNLDNSLGALSKLFSIKDAVLFNK